jgi:hypothetical protein
MGGAPTFDGGTGTDLPVDVDADSGTGDVSPSGPCDPVKQVGCQQAAEACYGYTQGAWQCLLPGPGGEGSACTSPSDCSEGTGCFAGPDGQACRPYCDPIAPSCTSRYPTCQVVPGSPWGVCSAPAQMDAGPPPPISCDPVSQTGCALSQDACYAFSGTSDLACLLPGPQSLFFPCSVHTDCQRGAGCFDGPNGRLCRPYCRLGAAECPGQAPVCMLIGRSDYGACAAAAPPPDGGIIEMGAAMMQSN